MKKEPGNTENPLADKQVIHIVFQHADIEILKKAIEMDDTLQGEVIQIKDDFAVGPLTEIDTEEGWQQRENWWRGLLEGSPYGSQLAGSFDDRKTVTALKEKLKADPAMEVWIWMAQNQHDVCSYFWLMPQLKDYQGRIMVLYLNNLPFINEKGQIFYPTTIHEILPKEIIKAKKLARPITLSEFEVDPDEWNRLVEEKGLVRILEGGKKIASNDETFYDSEILKNITSDWQKGWRVLSNTLHRMKIKTGDVYIMWRVKQLIKEGRIEVLGDVNKNWKEFDVKLAGIKNATEEVSTEEEPA
jgi:Domain of unknown function (DUF1835)./Protein of unknown function.